MKRSLWLLMLVLIAGHVHYSAGDAGYVWRFV